jgi:prolyl 4-hydroxylase
MHNYIIILLIFIIIYLYSIYRPNKTKKSNKVKKYKENFKASDNINDSGLLQPIKVFDNFISPNDCDELIKLTEGRFKESSIYTQNTGIVDKDARSSTNAFFKKGENELIKKIENKVIDMLNIKLEQLEPLQIVRYEKGQQYKYHYDFFDETVNEKQRLHTFLVYLNDLQETDGGATHFPLFRCKFFPFKTRAIYWENIDKNGNLNKLSLHAGEPLLTDNVKYVLTIWTRVP